MQKIAIEKIKRWSIVVYSILVVTLVVKEISEGIIYS